MFSMFSTHAKENTPEGLESEEQKWNFKWFLLHGTLHVNFYVLSLLVYMLCLLLGPICLMLGLLVCLNKRGGLWRASKFGAWEKRENLFHRPSRKKLTIINTKLIFLLLQPSQKYSVVNRPLSNAPPFKIFRRFRWERAKKQSQGGWRAQGTELFTYLTNIDW